MVRGQCFWCGESFGEARLTDDHVVPLGTGGRNEPRNIVRACEPCNGERGQLVSMHLTLIRLSKRTDRKRAELVKRMSKKLGRWQDLQRKWRDIERERLGYSPSGNLIIEIGDPKSLSITSAELREARRQAERRFEGLTG